MSRRDITCPTCQNQEPAVFDCTDCCGNGEVTNPDYDPSPCCNGVATGGAHGCMCGLKEPYAENH